ncbi:MAG: hypothetical protein ACRD29_14460 [Acidimicrobiales bacterium]
MRFLDWLAAHGITLATCTQTDLDLWLATGPRSRHDVHHFVEWTSERKLSTKLVVPPVRSGPGDALDAEQRWAIIAKLLRDPGVKVADRVAGSFVLLDAQPLSRVAVMTVDAVTITGTNVSVRFGTQAVLVPEPLAAHVTGLIATGRAHHVGIGSTTPSRWLFPGHLPGRPITANRLGPRLGVFGIDARAARRAAQLQLAAQVPAVVLAEMLGVTVNTAVDWVHAAGGDWANYVGVDDDRAVSTGLADCGVQLVQRLQTDRVDAHVGLYRVGRRCDLLWTADEERVPRLGEQAPIGEDRMVAAASRVLQEHVDVMRLINQPCEERHG